MITEKPKYCCKDFEKECREVSGFSGGGIGAYPESAIPTGQIEQTEDGLWAVNGCCGGGCYVLTGLKFCPFCGTKIYEDKND